MKGARNHRENIYSRSRFIGAVMTVVLHLLLFVIFVTTGFKTIYPPPPEAGILVEFELNEQQPIQLVTSREPRVENPNSAEAIRLIQRSESSIQDSSPNRGSESTMGEEGDIAQYEPPKTNQIDRRALFPSAANAASDAPQTANQSSSELRAGHADGNTRTGSINGEPQASLAGRSVVGSLPEPEYTVNKAGKVVVTISVDQYGIVTDAMPGAPGTTVQDNALYNAAKKAALDAKFNQSSSGQAAIQKGTITYIFTLK